MAATDTPTGDTDTDTGWQEAGVAWDHAATDWAFLFEPYGADGINTVLAATDVGPGTDLLDLACGSGYALAAARRRGARTAGIDAAAGLIDIARRRVPAGDLRWGSMFALPWADGSFDVVTSFNGIWGGCQEALDEAARVLRPGGLIGLTFWGDAAELDLRDYFITVGSSGPPSVAEEMVELAAINEPGVAEAMLARSGFEPVERGSAVAVNEWPDDETAWRALRSPGVVLPSLQHTGEAELRRRVLGAIAPFGDDEQGYRLESALTVVVARRR